ncbi:VOC family protein [Halomicrobium sp. LC1Hm]|uniref:VOC family protein n=1 Tax=Halomicrobium sp. LC1Hm TaxID=2610902 RepID=UPI001298444D|nr:VOC family protein [Halomicrobium sp. LC1Hm]
MSDTTDPHARLVGMNHVALEVGDIEDALDFYGDIFDVELRGRSDTSAFIDMGDQFIALSETNDETDDDRQRHFGLVVDDATVVEKRLEELDVEVLPGRGLDFRDPWGNRIQIVAYEDIQYTKPDHVLRAMGLDELEKTADAIAELEEKGMSPE